jgi:RNA polymerase sigma factor (sigma-70 family)
LRSKVGQRVSDRLDCTEDRDLARRAAGGDESVWREIFDRTADRIFSLLCYQVGDRDEALDLLQETFLQAFRHLAAYRGDAPLEVWLRMIALRKAIDWKRTVLRRWKRTVALTETSARIDPPDTEIRSDAERATLERALQSLSAMQRAALLLREWEEWSFREIATALGCKESTARVHHTRARERMRKILGEDPAFRAERAEGHTR